MAFTQDTFAPIGGQATESPSLFSYRTPDTLPVISAPGYFSEIQNSLEEGDVILVDSVDGSLTFRVLADTETVEPAIAINSFGASITDDAGDGTVAGDCNATDFTGNPNAVGTALAIGPADIVTFAHKNIAYLWNGPKSVTVGVGGSYVSTGSDFTAIGTADHAILANLSLPDQHPISAITGLVADQAAQDAAIAQTKIDLDDHILEPDPHPQYLTPAEANTLYYTQSTVDTLLSDNSTTDQGYTDTVISAHEGALDPHPQYQIERPISALFGAASSFSLGTGNTTITNYPSSKEINTSGTINAASGTITIPESGVYELVALIAGEQGNDNKEEQMRLGVQVDAQTFLIGVFDIATDKTSERAISGTVTRAFTAGQVVSLFLSATTGLGTFSFDTTTFELKKLAD